MDWRELRCTVCLELANQPQGTTCCHNLFCLDCIKDVRRCPICRRDPVAYQPNELVARMIDRLPMECPHCGEEITRGDLNNHTASCRNRDEMSGGPSTGDIPMQIFVKDLNGRTLTITVEPTETVLSLKKKIKERNGLAEENQRLIYSGRNLLDNDTLRQHEITRGSTIHLAGRLLGGGLVFFSNVLFMSEAINGG